MARARAILRRGANIRQLLSIGGIVKQTGFEHAMVYRVLKTLEKEGLLSPS